VTHNRFAAHHATPSFLACFQPAFFFDDRNIEYGKLVYGLVDLKVDTGRRHVYRSGFLTKTHSLNIGALHYQRLADDDPLGYAPFRFLHSQIPWKIGRLIFRSPGIRVKHKSTSHIPSSQSNHEPDELREAKLGKNSSTLFTTEFS